MGEKMNMDKVKTELEGMGINPLRIYLNKSGCVVHTLEKEEERLISSFNNRFD